MYNNSKSIPFWGAGEADSPALAPSTGYFSSNVAKPKASVSAVRSSGATFEAMRDRLGFFGKLAVDKASKEETKRVAGELVVQMLAAQKEQIVYQLCLELDASKKKMFVESLREGSKIESEIAHRSTEFERQLMDLALDEGLAGHQQRMARLNELDALRRSGGIDEPGYHLQRANIEHWAQVFGANLNAKVEIILRNHAHQIERTLALFRERSITGHTL